MHRERLEPCAKIPSANVLTEACSDQVGFFELRAYAATPLSLSARHRFLDRREPSVCRFRHDFHRVALNSIRFSFNSSRDVLGRASSARAQDTCEHRLL